MALAEFATIDRNGMLTLIGRTHPVPWLKGQKTAPCVVTVEEDGVVRIEPLKRWAASQGMAPEEAAQRLQAAAADPDDELYVGVFLREARVKRYGPGSPLRQIRLPHMAIYALFEQGKGPLRVRRGRGIGDSGKTLVVIRSNHVELWSKAVL